MRERFLEAGNEVLSDYEMLELILFRAQPRGDLKPLAKELLKTFGSFAETISAPVERLKKIKGLGDASVTELKLVQAAANPLTQAIIDVAKPRGIAVHDHIIVGRTATRA